MNTYNVRVHENGRFYTVGVYAHKSYVDNGTLRFTVKRGGGTTDEVAAFESYVYYKMIVQEDV